MSQEELINEIILCLFNRSFERSHKYTRLYINFYVKQRGRRRYNNNNNNNNVKVVNSFTSRTKKFFIFAKKKKLWEIQQKKHNEIGRDGWFFVESFFPPRRAIKSWFYYKTELDMKIHHNFNKWIKLLSFYENNIFFLLLQK